MHFSVVTVSLATSIFAGLGATLDLDIKNQDSIKSAAKTLASGIVAKYNQDVQADGIPGLFSDPYYWWEAGVVMNSLIDYSYLTGDSQFDDLVAEGMLHQVSESNDFMPPNQTKTLGNDDQSYWGLAAMAAAENGFSTNKLGSRSWVDFAMNVFDDQALRWNTKTCGGGLNWQIFKFNNGYTYKNSVSTGNFFLLAARLAKFTGNNTYTEWAEKAFEWTKNTGLISPDFTVFDGFDEKSNCSEINHIQWSSYHAIFTEGAAVMYKATNGTDKWKNAVTGFVNSSTVFHKDNAVLQEVACEKNGKCNTDQRAFKGLTARSYARAAISAPFVSDSLTPVLQASAQGAANGCTGGNESLACAMRWTHKDESVTGLGEAFSALSVVQALLLPDAKGPATNSSGTSSGGSPSAKTSTGAPATTGKPIENPNAADSLVASRNMVVALAMLAWFFL